MRFLLPGALAAAVVVLAIAGPEGLGLMSRCGFNALTGLHCPGCGGTRALQQLLRGDVVAALDRNALVVVALPMIAIAAVMRHRRRGTNEAPGSAGRPWIYAALGIVVLFWVLRNIDTPVLRVLAP